MSRVVLVEILGIPGIRATPGGMSLETLVGILVGILDEIFRGILIEILRCLLVGITGEALLAASGRILIRILRGISGGIFLELFS